MWNAVNRAALPEVVITSPLARCADFARALARRHALTLQVDARLRELDFGAWEGRTADEIEQAAPGALRRFYADPWRHGPPAGESLEHLSARVLAAWREGCALRGRALVITHGGPIRVILCHALRLGGKKFGYIDVPYGKLYSLTAPTAYGFSTRVSAR